MVAAYDEDLFDATPVHAHDGENVPIHLEDVALVGYSPGEVEHQAPHGVPAVLGEVEVVFHVHVVDVESSTHHQALRVEALDVVIEWGVRFIGDLADQLLEDVLQGDEAGGAAVFVDHDEKVALALADLGEQ